MRFKPHSYQIFATKYLVSHPIAALFLDCGLGKTVITLTAIYELMLERFCVRRVLVVAPLRVARDTWPAELAKWPHLKGLTYAVAVGSTEDRNAALAKSAMITIINRENIPWLIENHKWDYDMLVVDELSSFKSHSSKRFRALCKVRPFVERVVGLTGTPSPNGLMDLWAEYRLLDMGVRLGKFITHYRATYFRPDKTNGPVVYSYKPINGAEDVIYSKISDVTVSMRAIDHLSMPELLLQREYVTLDREEYADYARLKDEYVLNQNITASNAASLCGKLSQLANGAIYDDGGDIVEFHSRKLDALEDLIEAATGKPVMVAYWFKHDLERIKRRFPFAREIKTSADILDWNAKRIQLALIHPASAGHGLNLQEGGHILIWFGLTWSLELYQQTNARLWRQGQTCGTVVIKHILTKHTIDERIMTALEKKELTQSALIDAVNQEVRK